MDNPETENEKGTEVEAESVDAGVAAPVTPEEAGSRVNEPAEQQSEMEKAEDAGEDVAVGADPSHASSRREPGIEVPHWHALQDIFRVLPAEVLVRARDAWHSVSHVEKDSRGMPSLVTKDGEKLSQEETGDPVLVRPVGDSASKIK